MVVNSKQNKMEIDNDNNITVVGRKNPPPVAEAKTETITDKAPVVAPLDSKKSQEADNITVVGAKKEVNPLEVKKEVEADANLDKKKEPESTSKSESDKVTDKEDDKNVFAVDFGDGKKEVEKPSDDLDKKQEAVSLSEESVLQFLQKEYPDVFAEVNSISELSKKQMFAEPVKAFHKYHEETGRGIEDFYNLHKDWTEEDPEIALREYYKMTNEGLSESDIEDQLQLIAVTEDFELEHSDEEIKRRKLDFKKEYNKAIKYLKTKADDYKTPLKNTENSADGQPQQLSQEELADRYKPYWEARDKSLAEFESFDFSIGIGDVKLPISEEHKALIAEKSQTETSFFKSWITKDGINTKQTVEDTAWSIPQIRKQLLAEASKQIHAISIEADSKKRRNVKLDKVPEKAKEAQRRAVQVFGGQEESPMGTPLIKN